MAALARKQNRLPLQLVWAQIKKQNIIIKVEITKRQGRKIPVDARAAPVISSKATVSAKGSAFALGI